MNKPLILTLYLVITSLCTAAIAQETPVYLDDNKTIEERIEDAISRLTLEEKVAMCHAQSKFSTPGAPRLGIPEIWMSDGPHGVRAEIAWDAWNHAGWTNDFATAFPALTCLAASFNPDLAYIYGKAIGEEARFRKKDILLGPGCNIYRTPLNGRNFEYLGEDPYLASAFVVPYIKGVQENGVAACIKHYVLNNQERWREHIDVEVSQRALHEIYLPAFKAAVEKGKAWSVMSAYNQHKGQYCSHNEYLNNKILKGDWKFDGVIVTDWGAAHDTKQSALYGLDIEMGTGTNGLTSNTKSAYDYYFLADPFLKMLKAGTVPESVLNDKVKRILRLNFRTNMNKSRPWGSFATKAHAKIAQKVAEEGIVLLKNKKNFFPIPKDKYQKILVVGENAVLPLTKGGGSSELKTWKETSPLEGIKKLYGADKITHTYGYSSGPSVYGIVIPPKQNQDSLLRKAIELAKEADLVLYIGGLNKNHHQDCEGGDRLSYNLAFGQDKLIEQLLAVNPNFGLILISGNAVSMPWIEKVPGIIQSWYLGSEAGTALANIISGKVSPSGKVPFSYPAKLEDNAAHHFGKLSYPGDSTKVIYKEGIFVGYRWHDTQKIKPNFAFGHGLSYSKFKITDVKINKKNYSINDTINLSCIVKNTGDVNASEVVQAYVSMPKSKVERAVKELKGFSKIRVKAKSHEFIEIFIPVRSLAYYNETKAAFEVEKGKYTVFVGNASDKIFGRAKFVIE